MCSFDYIGVTWSCVGHVLRFTGYLQISLTLCVSCCSRYRRAGGWTTSAARSVWSTAGDATPSPARPATVREVKTLFHSFLHLSLRECQSWVCASQQWCSPPWRRCRRRSSSTCWRPHRPGDWTTSAQNCRTLRPPPRPPWPKPSRGRAAVRSRRSPERFPHQHPKRTYTTWSSTHKWDSEIFTLYIYELRQERFLFVLLRSLKNFLMPKI